MHDQPTQSPADVVMYTTSWCPSVRAARRYLDMHGIPYREVDIDRTPGAAKQLELWTGGYRTVPTFDIGGTIIIDFDMRQLRKVLGL